MRKFMKKLKISYIHKILFMSNQLIETLYPIDFRVKLSKQLGQHLHNRHSVEIIGMKRIGISNFLRFFINHKHIDKTFINNTKPRLLIPVDLNDLIERELFPFWRLTFKRIVDSLEKIDIKPEVKDKVANTFLTSIQTGDLLMTIDGVRDSLIEISNSGYIPTLFLIRFDRLKNTINSEFFHNLSSIISSTGNNLSFVFTSYRDLNSISEENIELNKNAAFTHQIFIKPAEYKDLEIIFNTLQEQYNLQLSEKIKKEMINNAGGHVQYLHLSFIITNDLDMNNMTPAKYRKIISSDERITLQSEELYDHLTNAEQDVLMKVVDGKKISKKEQSSSKYLWDSGILNKANKIFSLYFEEYLNKVIAKHKKNSSSNELTKKEHLLFTLLENNLSEICERDKIVGVVWPECKLYGVSDWSIDRLVSRLRKKLALRNSPYEIETIRTRGFKLVRS